MSDPWAVHDTRSTTESPRIGVPTSTYDPREKKASVEVEWNDGTKEEVKLSLTYRVFRLDSLDGLMLLAKETLPSEPGDFAQVFARALAGPSRSAMRAGEIRGAVAERTGLPRSQVETAWKRSRATFEALPEVAVEPSSAGAKYRLVGALEPLAIPSISSESPSSVEAAASVEPVAPGAPTASSEDAEAGATTSGETAGADSSHAHRDGLENEPELELEPEAKPAGPLARARRMEAAGGPTPVGDGPVGELDDVGAVLAMKKPWPIDAATLAAWLDTEAPGETLRAAVAEVDAARSDKDRSDAALSQFSVLLGRILKHDEARLPGVALAEAFLALQRSSNPSERHRGVEALDRLSAGLEKPTHLFDQLSLPSFQAAVRKLGLSAGGPRARFVEALAKRSAALASDAGWWRGFSWKDVRAVSTGPLHSLITATPALQHMVREAVDAFADTVDTRRALGELLGAPRFAVEHLSPERLSRIMALVAENDRLFSTWHAEFTRESELQQANRRLGEIEESAGRAAASEASRAAELEDLRMHLADAQRQVDALRKHTGSLTERERRQVLLDSAKAVAQIAATVDGDGGHLEHAELARKVNLLAERHGVSIDVARGETVAFDPARHSAPGSRPEPGEPVNVARTGYTWDDGEAAIVVLPALVTRVSIDETRS